MENIEELGCSWCKSRRPFQEYHTPTSGVKKVRRNMRYRLCMHCRETRIVGRWIAQNIKKVSSVLFENVSALTGIEYSQSEYINYASEHSIRNIARDMAIRRINTIRGREYEPKTYEIYMVDVGAIVLFENWTCPEYKAK